MNDKTILIHKRDDGQTIQFVLESPLLDDHVDAMSRFLRAIGFMYAGKLEIVD